ncbi:MAG: sterol desaturase family protein [Flavobacteriales bacterium]|jgi:sterol desaturase/sphingolipid hydroxylase (fatty acid hydroxylase superfamily)
MDVWKTITDGYTGYWNYFINEVAYPSWHNYFWWLVGISLSAWLLELAFPWRKNQKAIRQDFWMDGFYMFFNFFLFSLVGYNAISNVAVEAFNSLLASVGVENTVALNVQSWPSWAQLLLMFLVVDFISWNVHRMLHRVPWLWEFHKVHHSVEQMGFAAHLRYHWMETIVYKTFQYIPLAMIGFGLQDFFVVHIIALAIGHLNHSNLRITWGPLKYVLNSPAMHIWHHAKEIPEGSYGVNFGISLSIWDYLFGSVYMPKDGRDIPLGFDNLERFPKTFWKQLIYPFKK